MDSSFLHYIIPYTIQLIIMFPKFQVIGQKNYKLRNQ